jgi:hypothetical protein
VEGNNKTILPQTSAPSIGLAAHRPRGGGQSIQAHGEENHESTHHARDNGDVAAVGRLALICINIDV